MPKAAEHLEHAEHVRHAENKKIALVIAILALFLSFAETLGKSAQIEAIDADVKSADSWNFFQAKDIRKTTLLTTADQSKLLGAGLTDPAAKAAIDKQAGAWHETAARYESERKEIGEHAKDQERERDQAMAKYHHFEIASAAFQVGIVLASAAVIIGIMALVWVAGAFGVAGLVLLALGLFAPYAVSLV